MKLGNKFQAGGPMPAGAPAPAPQGGEDPTAMLLQGAHRRGGRLVRRINA